MRLLVCVMVRASPATANSLNHMPKAPIRAFIHLRSFLTREKWSENKCQGGMKEPTPKLVELGTIGVFLNGWQ